MRKLIFWAFFFLILVNVVYVFAGVHNFPLHSVDAYSDWMLKAKVLYLSREFPYSFFQNWKYMASHMQYPILLPTFISFLYTLFGFYDHAVLYLYPLVYAIILLLCWKTLRALQTHSHIAIACVYIYSMLSPLLAQGGRAHAGNADIVLVLLEWCVVYVISKLVLSKQMLLFLLVLVMIASQIKSEGIFLAYIFLFLPLRTISKRILFASALIPFIAWTVFTHTYQFAADLVYRPVPISEFLLRSGTIMYGYLLELVNYKNWYIFWLVCIGALFVPYSIHPKIKTVFLPTAMLILCSVMGSYLFAHFARTDIHILRYVTSSADRVLFQLTPWIFPYFAQAVSEIVKPYFSWPKVSNKR